jgi:FkbM family methyltransferase
MKVYNFKQFIRDLALYIGNPLNLFNFSPQHQALIKLHPFSSVLHIGANIGQELSLYNYMGIKKVIWIEPDKQAFINLKKRAKFYRKINNQFINELITQFSNEKVTYYEFSQSGANSIYEPTEKFLKSKKNRYVTKIISISSLNIEDALEKYNVTFDGNNNLLVIDVQGGELSVLKGFSVSTLMKFRVIMCELSTGIYENNIPPKVIKSFLVKLGYREFLTPIRTSDDGIFLRTH